MARKGLGKGLDSLIPDFYDDEFDSNSTKSLADLLDEDSNVDDDADDSNVENISEDNDVKKSNVEESSDENEQEIEEKEEEAEKSIPASEDVSASQDIEDDTPNEEELKIQENVAEVKEIVEKNPRITLWSSQSAAVFRYLRKTEPEFSISKEASSLIDEAVSKKYPDIWELFDE